MTAGTITAGGWLLIAVLAVPALGAAAVALLPAHLDRAARALGTGVAALTLVLAAALYRSGGDWSAYAPHDAGPPAILPWHELDLPWVPSLGSELPPRRGRDLVPAGGADRAADAALLRVHALAGARRAAAGGRWWRCCWWSRSASSGVFLALDLVLFFVFFEVVLLPMYAIIAGWGGERRRHAAREVRPLHAGRLGAAAGRRLRGGRRRRHRATSSPSPAARV